MMFRPLLGIFYTLITFMIIVLYFLLAKSLQPKHEDDQECFSDLLTTSEKNWNLYKHRREIIIGQNQKFFEKHPFGYVEGKSIWDLFPAQYTCPHGEELVGNFGSGGKWICGLQHLAKKPDPCIIYIFGEVVEYSFEEDMFQRTNCTIYFFNIVFSARIAYDLIHTYGKQRAMFKKTSIGAQTVNGREMELGEHLEVNGHKYLDILKIDIDGKEFAVFQQICSELRDGVGFPFGHLIIQLHLTEREGMFNIFNNFWNSLENGGLRAFRQQNYHTQNIHTDTEKNITYQYRSEYSFININPDPDNYLING